MRTNAHSWLTSRPPRARCGLRLAVATVLCVVLVAACGEGETGAGGSGGGRLIYASMEPPAIDPLHVMDSFGFEVAGLLFDGLVDFDENLNVVPAVARSWDVNDDITVFTFHLRNDVTFHNGRAVTADDFVYAFNRVADPDNASGVAYHGLPIAGWGDVMEGKAEEISGVRAVDDHTLEITTAEPFTLLPKVLGHAVFSPVPEEDVDDDYGDKPVGNGPFMIAEPWQHNERILVERFEGYYAEAAKPAAVEFRLFADQETAFRELQDGNIDVAQVEAERLPEAREDFGERLAVVTTGTLVYVGFDVTTAPFDQPAMREALSLAIDRESMVARLFHGALTVATGLVPPNAPGAVADACSACIFDPERAKERLSQVAGAPSELTLYYPTGRDDEYLKAIADAWRATLGIDTRLEGMEFSVFLERLEEGFDGPYVLAWVWDFPSAYSFLSPLLSSGSADNSSHYSNAELDDLLAQATAAEDEASANAALEDAQRIAGRDLPLIPLFFAPVISAHSDRVGNVRANAMGVHNFTKMTVEG